MNVFFIIQLGFIISHSFILIYDSEYRDKGMIQSNNGTLKIHATSMDQTLWLPLTGNPCSNKTTAQVCVCFTLTK